jgi:hypothetical protein
MIFMGRDPCGGSVRHVHRRGRPDQVAALCWHLPHANAMVARDAGLRSAAAPACSIRPLRGMESETMRIARFNGGRIGVVIGDTIRDVTAAAGVDPAEWPPLGMVRLIANFPVHRDKLAEAARSAPTLLLANLRLETPVPWPN